MSRSSSANPSNQIVRRPTTRSQSFEPVRDHPHNSPSAPDYSDLPMLETEDCKDPCWTESKSKESIDQCQDQVVIMSDILSPGTFSGEGHEDAELWWSAVSSWLKLRKLSGEAAVVSVGLLLKENARRWFNSLADDSKVDMKELSEAFGERYCVQNTAWKDRVALFECRQLTNQSAADYLQVMETKAAKSGATTEQVVAAIINGLLPAIKQQVLHHEPTSVADIRKWAILIENTKETREEQSITDLTKAVLQMKNQLDRLQCNVLHDESTNKSRSRSDSPIHPTV